jgi:AP endonuclease-1
VKTGSDQSLPTSRPGGSSTLKQENDEDKYRKSTTEGGRAHTDSPSRPKRKTAKLTETQVKVEEQELSRSVKSKRTERSALKRFSYAESDVENIVVADEVEEEEEIITKKKITRKRKTKAEKEAEMAPLAARTQGLRMFVGAHVSAAKGWFAFRSYHCQLCLLCPFYVNKLKFECCAPGVHNSVTNSMHIG